MKQKFVLSNDVSAANFLNIQNINNLQELFNKNKNYVIFYMHDYNGAKGILKHIKNKETFFNLDYTFIDEYKDFRPENRNKILVNFKYLNRLFKEKFDENAFLDFAKVNKYNPKTNFKIYKFHIKFLKYFDDSYEKYLVYRDPLISMVLSLSDPPYYLEDFKSLESYNIENLKIINYDMFLQNTINDVLTDFDYNIINFNNYNKAKEILDSKNIKYNYILKEI